MIAGPPLPDRPAEAPGRPQDVVPGERSRAVLLPEAAVLADGSEGMTATGPKECPSPRAATRQDRRMASPGVKGAVARYGADLLAIRDLVEKLRQNWAVALSAGGELHRPDVACRGIHGQMDLAVLAAAVRAVLPGQPLIRRAYAAAPQPRSLLIHRET
ncbi:hypothetical protein SDC9_36560 [bioreactor metagenome]|uniref:Uncharacterized protein n=1 Tax=bioreactor metagenome TaxID=1076179 RepID=A0A644VGK4_9ZZZZ